MLLYLLQLILGIAIGIYGYLLPGYINLTVLQLSLDKNTSLIRKVLMIVSLIEIPYCFFCMSGMQWLMQQSMILLIIKWILVVMLFLIALLAFREAGGRAKQVQLQETSINRQQVNKLLFFAIFNPFQLSAWVIWGGYFIEKSWFDWSWMPILLFSLGAAMGVFLILYAYAVAGQKLIAYFSSHRSTIDYSVAFILFLLGVLQLWRNTR
jgi:hypothetical protein